MRFFAFLEFSTSFACKPFWIFFVFIQVSQKRSPKFKSYLFTSVHDVLSASAVISKVKAIFKLHLLQKRRDIGLAHRKFNIAKYSQIWLQATQSNTVVYTHQLYCMWSSPLCSHSFRNHKFSCCAWLPVFMIALISSRVNNESRLALRMDWLKYGLDSFNGLSI